MKYYIRQIKPYIEPPALQGCNCALDPVEGYDWQPEDVEEDLRNEIMISDPWSKLVFKERFIEAPKCFTGICICKKDYNFNTGDKIIPLYSKNDVFRFKYKPDANGYWCYFLYGIADNREYICSNYNLFNELFDILEKF